MSNPVRFLALLVISILMASLLVGCGKTYSHSAGASGTDNPYTFSDPEVRIMAPGNGSKIVQGELVQIVVSAVGNPTIQDVSLAANNATLPGSAHKLLASASLFHYTLDTSSLALGENTISATATNTDNKTKTVSITINVLEKQSASLPNIAINSPRWNEKFEDMVEVLATITSAKPITAATVSINGAAPEPMTLADPLAGIYGYSFSLKARDIDSALIEVSAANADGQKSAYVLVYMATSDPPPFTVFFRAPLAGESIGGNSVPILVDASSAPAAVKQAVTQADLIFMAQDSQGRLVARKAGTLYETTDDSGAYTGMYSGVLNTAPYNNGNAALAVSIGGTIGLVEVVIDNAPDSIEPTGPIRILEPSSNEVVRNVVTVRARVKLDSPTGVQFMAVSPGGIGRWMDMLDAGGGIYTGMFDSRKRADGPLTLTVKAASSQDPSAGYSYSVPILVKNETLLPPAAAPKVTIVSPKRFVGGPLAVISGGSYPIVAKVEFNSPLTGPAKLQINMDGTPKEMTEYQGGGSTPGLRYYYYLLDTTQYAEGQTLTLKVTAQNIAGIGTDTVLATVSNLAPPQQSAVTIITPRQGSRINTVDINALVVTLPGSLLPDVTYKITSKLMPGVSVSGAMQLDPDSPLQGTYKAAEVNTSSLPEDIGAILTVTASNVGEDSIDVIIDNSITVPPVGPGQILLPTNPGEILPADPGQVLLPTNPGEVLPADPGELDG